MTTDPLNTLRHALSAPQLMQYIWDPSEHTLILTRDQEGHSTHHHISESSWMGLIHPADRNTFLGMKNTIRDHARPFVFEYRLMPQGNDENAMRITHSGNCSDNPENSNDYITGTLEVSYQNTNMPAVQDHNSEFSYPEPILHALGKAIDKSKSTNTTGALLIGSISNLAMILSAYGHDVAETVVRQLLDQIRQSLSPDDIVERLGRDQFVIILVSRDKLEPHLISQQIHTRIQYYAFTTVHGALHVICSIGSVDFPTSATSAIDALDKAYIALSHANGITYRAYEESQDETSACRQQLGLANYLRGAIQQNRMRLAYQPVIETQTGKVTHYEALLRLISDDGKISSAGALLPIAERMGLIDMVDMMVLEMVVKELEAAPDLTLALNVSNLTTDNMHWLARFQELTKNNTALTSRLIVEITETAVHRDLRQTAYFVASLQAQGCQVALDDFGSGYTSFRQLKALSVDMVKIDGSFIKDLTHSADNQFFVRTLLDFTHGFGLKAVAEFVENGETAKMLMDMGVDYLQGYYFGRPQNNRSWLHQGE